MLGSDSKKIAAMKQLEKERIAAQKQVENEFKETMAQLDECKKKLEGVRTRSRIQDLEIANLKSRLSVLLDKSNHDDQLIATLNVSVFYNLRVSNNK